MNPILIIGETGTGKELVAKAVHTLRHPNDKFVAVNCAALTATLLESELFGHVRGAFTGADRDKMGLLELAGSGTLLLDEISEMPTDLQAKLLRVLQERTFRKVGGVKDITCSATIIASSNRNLRAEVQANRFRRDLYYRLDVSPIVLAPLRSPERREDVRLLAEYFLEVSTICPEKRNKVTSLTRLAVEALEKHDWPGNVRELRNVIDRAILLETTDKIGLSRIIIDATQCAQASENPTAGLMKKVFAGQSRTGTDFPSIARNRLAENTCRRPAWHNQGHTLCQGQAVQHLKGLARFPRQDREHPGSSSSPSHIATRIRLLTESGKAQLSAVRKSVGTYRILTRSDPMNQHLPRRQPGFSRQKLRKHGSCSGTPRSGTVIALSE